MEGFDGHDAQAPDCKSIKMIGRIPIEKYFMKDTALFHTGKQMHFVSEPLIKNIWWDWNIGSEQFKKYYMVNSPQPPSASDSFSKHAKPAGWSYHPFYHKHLTVMHMVNW